MARFKTLNQIVNQVASETLSLDEISDVTASTDKAIAQLITLVNSCGEELLSTEAWNKIRRQHHITTTSADTGKYDLPSDFAYMIPQTGWDRSQNVPAFGPVSPQEWQWLLGRDLVSTNIYASFRLAEGEFWLYPYADGSVTVPDGLEIYFEYVSRSWVLEKGVDDTFTQEAVYASDVILYEHWLFSRLLKARFLEARGFDNTVALAQYKQALDAWAGHDKSAPVLNAAAGPKIFPYLDIHRSTPDTGYGS